MNENGANDCSTPDVVLGLGIENGGTVSGGTLGGGSNQVTAGGWCTCCQATGTCANNYAMARLQAQTCAAGAYISGYLCRGAFMK